MNRKNFKFQNIQDICIVYFYKSLNNFKSAKRLSKIVLKDIYVVSLHTNYTEAKI